MKIDNIRPATNRDRESILGIWHQGWHDAHGELVPPSILAYRTPEHFAIWLEECAGGTFGGDHDDTIVGFYTLEAIEVSKLYVRREARGSGVARILLSHAEDSLASRGVAEAELFCTVGNQRAQRCYERNGCAWRRHSTMVSGVPNPASTFHPCRPTDTPRRSHDGPGFFIIQGWTSSTSGT